MSSGPPWPPKAMANLFLEWFDASGEGATPLKLQKTLYFCHADFLIKTGSALVSEEFEAWRYGPVLPSVFREFRPFAGRAIAGRAAQFDPITLQSAFPIAQIRCDLEGTLKEIFSVYAPVEAGVLSDVSHRLGGPWSRALELFASHRNINRRISNELILERHQLLFHL